MFNLFSKFSKKDESPLDFAPELDIFYIKSQDPKDRYITLRIASGDENNINKNFKFPAHNIIGLSLKLDFSENKYDPTLNQNDHQFVDAKALLIMDLSDSEEPKTIELANHKIAAFGTHNKKDNNYSYPSKDEVEREANNIWQDEFSVALQDYNDALNGTSNNGSGRSKPSNKEEKSKLDKLITVGSIVIILISIGFVVINKLTKNINNQSIIGSMNSEQILQDAQVGINQQLDTPDQIIDNSEEELEKDVLNEFGLESGVNLDR